MDDTQRTFIAITLLLSSSALPPNLLVIVSLLRNWRNLKTHHFYTFSVTLSDFLSSFCNTITSAGILLGLLSVQDESFYIFWYLFFLSNSTSFCSVVVVALDRYWAISHVFHYRQHSTPRLAKGVLSVTWGLFITVFLGAFFVDFRSWVVESGIVYFYSFTIPLWTFLMLIWYVKIYLVIRESTHWQTRRGSMTTTVVQILRVSSSPNDYEARQLRTTILLFLTVFSCFVCWVPFSGTLIVELLMEVILNGVEMVSILLMQTSMIFNPWIYALRIACVKDDMRKVKNWILCRTKNNETGH